MLSKQKYRILCKIILYTYCMCNLVLYVSAEKEPREENEINTNPSPVRLNIST